MSENTELLPDNTLILQLSNSKTILYQLQAGQKFEDFPADNKSASGISTASSRWVSTDKVGEPKPLVNREPSNHKKSFDRQQLLGLLSIRSLLGDTRSDLHEAIGLCERLVSENKLMKKVNTKVTAVYLSNYNAGEADVSAG